MAVHKPSLAAMGLDGAPASDGTDVQRAEDTLPGLEPVDAVPLQVLPSTLRQWATEAAEALPSPPDFLVVPALVVAGTALGANCRIEVKPGWTEGPQLFAAIVAEPGAKKSPAIAAAMEPVWAQQRRAFAEASREPEAPLAQYLTTDTTIEALAVLHQANPRGVLVAPDELTAWVAGMGQYKRGTGADRPQWLSLWNGGSLLVNRKSSGPIFVDRTCVGVVGSVPPEVLDRLAGDGPAMVSPGADGFLDRILWAWPDSLAPRWSDAALTPAVAAAYARLIDGVREFGSSSEELRVLQMSPHARQEWLEWMDAHNRDSRSVPDRLRGAWAKCEGLGARLVLILHALRVVDGATDAGAIDAASVAAAWSLTDYFKTHARRVVARWPDTRTDRQCLRVVAFTQRQGGRITAREIQHQQVAGLKTAADVHAVLATLEQRGYGRVSPGARGSTLFELCPTPDRSRTRHDRHR